MRVIETNCESYPEYGDQVKVIKKGWPGNDDRVGQSGKVIRIHYGGCRVEFEDGGYNTFDNKEVQLLAKATRDVLKMTLSLTNPLPPKGGE